MCFGVACDKNFSYDGMIDVKDPAVVAESRHQGIVLESFSSSFCLPSIAISKSSKRVAWRATILATPSI